MSSPKTLEMPYTVFGFCTVSLGVLSCGVSGTEGGDGAGDDDHLHAVGDGSLQDVVEAVEVDLVGGPAVALREGRQHGGHVEDRIHAVFSECVLDLVVPGYVDIIGRPRPHLFRQWGGVSRRDDVLVAEPGPQRRDQLGPDLAAGARHEDSLHLTLRFPESTTV